MIEYWDIYDENRNKTGRIVCLYMIFSLFLIPCKAKGFFPEILFNLSYQI